MPNTFEKTFQYAIWNNHEDKAPLQFIESALIALNEEISICMDHYSFHDIKLHNYENQHTLFWLCTEMSWISLLNNAIIRKYGNLVSTLREISVHENEKGYVGRPDLLVSWKHYSRTYHFLFEGKMWEWKGSWNKTNEDDEMKIYYESILKQANKYKDHLANQIIKEYNPLIVTIAFDWMRTKEAVASAKTYFNNEASKDKQTTFHALYTWKDSGMWTYGKIFNLKEI